MADEIKQTDPGRRHFLNRLGKALLALVAAVFSYPLLRFTEFKVKPQPKYIVINKKIPVGGYFTEHDFILFVFAEGPIAVSRRCTHLGCRVHFRQALELIECPCHQSRFTTTGERISGPAQKNLPVFPVRVLLDDSGELTGYEVKI